VLRGTACLLSPNRVRVGVEIPRGLGTGAHNARVKYVRAPVAVGYLTEYAAAARIGTQGKTLLGVYFYKGKGLFF